MRLRLVLALAALVGLLMGPAPAAKFTRNDQVFVNQVRAQGTFALSATNGTVNHELRLASIRVVSNGGVLSTEVLNSATDAASESNPPSAWTSTVTPLTWTITTGAQVGTFVADMVITGGTSSVTAVVVSKTASTLVVKTWSGLAWTAGETLTGDGAAPTTTFTSIAGTANAHGFSTGITTRATTGTLLYAGTSANNAANFGGVAVVGYNDTDTALVAELANRGATAGWSITFTNAATGADFPINTTNWSSGEAVRIQCVIFTQD